MYGCTLPVEVEETNLISFFFIFFARSGAVSVAGSSFKQNPITITPTMLTSLRRLPLRKFVQASAKNPLLPASRNFQSSGFQAADSMGKLIESGKEGAEFVVSGKL